MRMPKKYFSTLPTLCKYIGRWSISWKTIIRKVDMFDINSMLATYLITIVYLCAIIDIGYFFYKLD
jgi:hypothetical protein